MMVACVIMMKIVIGYWLFVIDLSVSVTPIVNDSIVYKIHFVNNQSAL
jgi:hypothetical protein